MSTTTTTVAGDPAPDSASFFGHWLSAATHFAGGVYHKILAIEGNVAKWENDNPALTPIIAVAANSMGSALSAAGIPIPALKSAADMLMSALGTMAANDPTIQSGSYAPPVAAPKA
jgi:hypothetical protein